MTRRGGRKLDELGKVSQRAGQAVDLVDDDDIDLSALISAKQALQSRPIVEPPE